MKNAGIRSLGVFHQQIEHRVYKNTFHETDLTEAPLREFTGVRQRENDFEIYEWTAKCGVNFNL